MFGTYFFVVCIWNLVTLRAWATRELWFPVAIGVPEHSQEGGTGKERRGDPFSPSWLPSQLREQVISWWWRRGSLAELSCAEWFFIPEDSSNYAFSP